MQTQEVVKTETQKESIQLVKGLFSPEEASNVVITLIDQKINFHKIQRMQLWEGNHKCDTDQINKRIKELEAEKVVAKQFIAQNGEQGTRLSINAILNISVED